MRIAICDDDRAERTAVRQMIGEVSVAKTAVIDDFEDGNLLLKAQGVKPYDIIFMDVDMPERTGIEIGKQLRMNDSGTILIFVTGYPQYAIEAYDCDAFHYLLKPLHFEKFEQILLKAVNKYNTLHARITLETSNGIIVLPDHEICYVECMRKNLIYHTSDGSYTVRDTLSNAMTVLLPHGFCQTHQGFIVNLNMIRKISTNEALLTNGMKVMISVRRQKEVERIFTDFLEKTL